MAKVPKCLVIDTDIASAASEKNTMDARSKDCRDFLLAVRGTGHKVVTSETIRAEWRKHQSLFTKTWLVSMYAQRRVHWVDAPADDGLRRKVVQATSSDKKREAMLKDIHLIEAACQADKIISSLDETVRNCFHEATRKVGILRQIAWVNPCKSEETAIAWLRDGAELENGRLLGYRGENRHISVTSKVREK